jgi:zinc/manganese transport system substrate-binding protein
MNTSKKFLVAAAASLASFAATPAFAKINVVTTTQDPAAITRAIGGDRVNVTALCKGFQDPHFLDAKPSFMVDINRAQLVEEIGLELEIGYLPSLVAGARNEKVAPGKPGFLDLSQFVKPMDVVALADRGQGDVHPNGNPHYWLDPENGRLLARGIAARLTELDPAGKDAFAANLATFEKTLDAKEADWAKRMAPFKGEKIVTYHKSWNYFGERYGMNIAGQVEPKPGIPPTPAHTLELIKLMKEQNVKVILMENFYDRRAPDVIANATGAKVVYVPNSVGGDDAVKTYFDLFDKIVSTFESTKGT